MLRFELRCIRAALTPLQALLIAVACNPGTREPSAGSVASPAPFVCEVRSAAAVGTRSWAATGPLAEAVGRWLRQSELDGQVVVPSCAPRVACGSLLSLYCEWPSAHSAPGVRAATWWSCAELPPLRLSVSNLCDESAACVARVTELLRGQLGLQYWRVTDDMALRLNGLEFVTDGAPDDRTVVVSFSALRRAFQSARGFDAVTTQLEACSE